MLAPMAPRTRARDPASVFTATKHAPTRRDPDTELYDHACELVESAAAIRQAATVPGSGDAVPALLGCVDAALRDLAAVAEALARTGGDDRRHRRASEGYRNLRVALDDAAIAARAAQALAARAGEAR
jgi:hypothetical protein